MKGMGYRFVGPNEISAPGNQLYLRHLSTDTLVQPLILTVLFIKPVCTICASAELRKSSRGGCL